jgi:rifampicin phosphotransferase
MTVTRGDPPTAAIIGLHRLGREDASRVGAKAANLGELIRAGFSVPTGFVATGEADEATIAAAAVHLGCAPLAVRSSISAEDRASASFAGQYESLLNVRGANALEAAVRRVRASVSTERVRRYAAEVAGSDIDVVGVIVQRQVAADVAGVVFTANPVTGAAEVVISAVRGLGGRLVSGVADPDEWVVRDGLPTCMRAPERSLRQSQVREIAAAVRRVAAHFGFPVDVEWAFEGERLWLLQARPITALPGAVEPAASPTDVPEGFWERDFIHYPHPLSPMCRLNLTVTSEASTVFAAFGMPIDGIVYAEIGGWAYARLVPLNGKQPPALPRWFAPAANAVMARAHPPLRRRIKRLREVERTGALMATVSRWWDRDRATFVRRIGSLQDAALATLSNTELSRHFDELIRFSTDAWKLHFRLHVSDITCPMRLALFCHDHFGWPEQDALAMLAGLSVASTQPGRALTALAAMAAHRPAVQALLADPDDDTLNRLEKVDATFAEAVHAYLHEFGCRALRYDVSEPTLAEVPSVALGLVRDQLTRSYDATARAAAQQDERDAAVNRARAALRTAPTDVRDRFEALLDDAQRAYPIREDNEFWLVSAPLALMRYAALEIGRRLAVQGQLDTPEQVFLLEVDEAIGALADGTDVRATVRRRTDEAAWTRSHPGPGTYGQPPRPPRLTGLPRAMQEDVRALRRGVELMFETELSARQQETDKGVLEGVSASPGVYTGPARVVNDEAQFGKIRGGDVLVCPITSPVWSVLFASVGALVTDTGGILSHSAIIAREYHIPAVVATGNATTLLRDGQSVTVDGSTGVIAIGQPLERAS